MKNNAGNSAHMKLRNRQAILNIIRRKPVSRAELARLTGLTRAAMSVIIDELVMSGLILETGIGEADYGRKPVLLDINPDYYHTVALYLSRGSCTLGIVDLKGRPLVKKELDISKSGNSYAALEQITIEIKGLIDNHPIEQDKLLGIGISAPGPLDVYEGRILNPPNFEMWHGVDIVRQLKKKLPYDIYLENNAIALTLAEKSCGIGIDFHSFMLLTVDTGIGAGIVIEDRLYRGVGGFGSEVGHTSVDMNGKACSCGNRGCLEVYASIPSVLKEAQKYAAGITSWEDIVDMAVSGDEYCSGILEKEARYLSAGIVNMMNVLELEAVVLTGMIRYKSEILCDRISGFVEKTSITRDIHKLRIMTSSLVEDADIISAAAVVMEKFFKSE